MSQHGCETEQRSVLCLAHIQHRMNILPLYETRACVSVSVAVIVGELTCVVTLAFSEQREATVLPCLGVTRRNREVLSRHAFNPRGLGQERYTRPLLAGPLPAG